MKVWFSIGLFRLSASGVKGLLVGFGLDSIQPELEWMSLRLEIVFFSNTN